MRGYSMSDISGESKPSKKFYESAWFGCWHSHVNRIDASYKNESKHVMILAELLMTSTEYLLVNSHITTSRLMAEEQFITLV